MKKKILILMMAMVLVASFAYARGKPTPVKSDDSTTVTLKPGQSMRFDAGTGVSISVGGDGTGVSVYITSTASGGSAPGGGTAGGFQFNDGGVLNGIAELRAIKNASGVTTVFGMSTAGATIWALNWQGYAYVGYYPGGTTEFLKDTSGVTQYDAAGNVLWSTISGFYISGIEAPSANITMKTAVFDTSRSGVSKTGRGQCDVGTDSTSKSGVSLYAVTIGTTFKHEGPGASAYQLPPIISGATYYLRVDDPLGTGVTIYSGVSTQAIYVGSYGGDGVCIPSASAVSGYAITLFAEELSSGASRWWSTLGSSSAVSAIRNRNW